MTNVDSITRIKLDAFKVYIGKVTGPNYSQREDLLQFIVLDYFYLFQWCEFVFRSDVIHTCDANANLNTSDIHTSSASKVRYARTFGHPDKVEELVAFSVLILGLWLIRRKRQIREHRARRPKRV